MAGSILHRVSEKIYCTLVKSRLAYLYFPKEVRQDILLLGKDEKEYYIQKLQYTCGLLLAGILLIGFFIIAFFLEKNEQVTVLERPEAYQEAKDVVLQAGEQDISLEVAPVTLTMEEAETLFREAADILKEYILGGNTGLDSITGNLILPEFLEGYPFDIYWESSRENIVDTLGNVNREGISEDTVVVLTAEFSYRDWLWQEQFGILVLKESLTLEEHDRRELEKFLKENESANRDEAIWQLPAEFEGKELQYHIVQTDYTLLWLAVLVAAAGFILWLGQDYDLRAARRKRRAIFQTEYAALVNSLSMYISTGMTLQKAMLLCADDYEKRKPTKHILRVALNEFRKDLDNGYSFSAAMGRFANACDEASYKKLAGILNQGVMNSAQGLSGLLEKEVMRVNEEKRRQTKIKGEQISTALIAPMMLQLGIVIALIILPAFSNLQF